MTPVLQPGDRVIAVRGRLVPGDLVAVRDPRDTARIVVKRVDRVGIDGAVRVLGDNPTESTDSRTFGEVDRRLVVGRVVYRYFPLDRAGRFTRRAR